MDLELGLIIERHINHTYLFIMPREIRYLLYKYTYLKSFEGIKIIPPEPGQENLYAIQLTDKHKVSRYYFDTDYMKRLNKVTYFNVSIKKFVNTVLEKTNDKKFNSLHISSNSKIVLVKTESALYLIIEIGGNCRLYAGVILLTAEILEALLTIAELANIG